MHAPNESPKLREYQASMGRLIGALEWAWKAIQSRHPETPEVIITVASGDRHRKLGHFSPDRWEVLDEGERPEVLIGAEGLKRLPTDVLGTLLHEAAHGLAHVRGIKDTSRRGHYHNGRFREMAMELGLGRWCAMGCDERLIVAVVGSRTTWWSRRIGSWVLNWSLVCSLCRHERPSARS
jgi:hypothetical protein